MINLRQPPVTYHFSAFISPSLSVKRFPGSSPRLDSCARTLGCRKLVTPTITEHTPPANRGSVFVELTLSVFLLGLVEENAFPSVKIVVCTPCKTLNDCYPTPAAGTDDLMTSSQCMPTKPTGTEPVNPRCKTLHRVDIRHGTSANAGKSDLNLDL